MTSRLLPTSWLWAFLLVVVLCGGIRSEAATRQWPHYTYSSDSVNYRNDAVKAAQYLLHVRGFKIAVDGVLGRRTVNSIKLFQKSRKLAITGELNNPTWEKLIIPVRRGSRGDAVRAVQTLLRYYGANLRVDGVFGLATQQGVKAFQKKQRLTTDGIVGANTWRALVDGVSGVVIGDQHDDY